MKIVVLREVKIYDPGGSGRNVKSLDPGGLYGYLVQKSISVLSHKSLEVPPPLDSRDSFSSKVRPYSSHSFRFRCVSVSGF